MIRMRCALIVCACLAVIACGDDDTGSSDHDAGTHDHASNHDDKDASTTSMSMQTGTTSSPDSSDKPDANGKLSKPGKYQGYSERRFKGYALSSEYVAVRDGTKLAMDLYRPKDDKGNVVTERLPVLFMHTPYDRRYFTVSAGSDPQLTGESYPGTAAKLVEYGYVVAIADFRGLYASFGTNIAYNRGEWVEAARMDAYDLIEWLAKQSWSSGKIGMWGCSATGGSQLQAATTAPPHLKAIMPMSCEFDAYPFAVPGGMAPPKGVDTSAPPMPLPDAEMRDMVATPVDADSDKAQLMAAHAEHKDGVDNLGYLPFRDSTDEHTKGPWWQDSSPHTHLDAINQSGIAVYLAANWDEATTKQGAFYTFNNLTTPKKLIVGPGTHCAWMSVMKDTGFDITIEELRFFDYWLKDIKNGVMDEPAVTYYEYNAPQGQEWRTSDQWPLADAKPRQFYFGARLLGVVPASNAMGSDSRTVDYDVTADNMLDKGLVYQSPALSVDYHIIGHPVADLWVSSTATDGDFIVTLQDLCPTARPSRTTRRVACARRIAKSPMRPTTRSVCRGIRATRATWSRSRRMSRRS